jgi:hypothetical protein
MSDLKKLRKLFRGWGVPTADWEINPEPDCPEGVRCLVFGCPDGGAYFMAIFDEEGEALSMNVIEHGGDPCSCKYCKRGTL